MSLGGGWNGEDRALPGLGTTGGFGGFAGSLAGFLGFRGTGWLERDTAWTRERCHRVLPVSPHSRVCDPTWAYHSDSCIQLLGSLQWESHSSHPGLVTEAGEVVETACLPGWTQTQVQVEVALGH